MKALVATLLLLSAGSALAGGDPARGEQLSAPCAVCHGPGGVSASGAFPTLAGQHRDYLVHALKQYADGTRKNALMAPQAANLSARDIKDLAAYYAGQPGPLYTPRIGR